jgi:hypothetical protein
MVFFDEKTQQKMDDNWGSQDLGNLLKISTVSAAHLLLAARHSNPSPLHKVLQGTQWDPRGVKLLTVLVKR